MPPTQEQSGANTVAFVKTEASVSLDLLRGLAAVFVLGEHWRNLLFVDWPQLAAHRMRWAVPYLLTSAGHQSVVVFFVLSGYLISGSVFRSLANGTWSWKSYACHRLVRLWVVLLPGLALCLLLDLVGIRLGHGPELYAGLSGNHMLGNVREAISARIVLGNAFFLQGLRVPMLGSDRPLWSLANEFWYYVLFPLLVIVCVKGRGWHSRIAAAVTFAMLCWYVRGGVLIGFPIWLMGTALAAVRPPKVGRRARLVAAIVYAPLLFAMTKLHGVSGWQLDYLLGFLTTALVWILLSSHREADPHALRVRGSRTLARFSYTLYVTHMPLLVLLASLSAGDTRWQPSARHLASGGALLGLALLWGYGVAWGTEFRTDSVRRWVERRLGIAQRPKSSPHAKALAMQD